jgi:Icc-related predicted phosphoesterase
MKGWERMERGTYWVAFGDMHDDIARAGDIPELAKAAGIIVTGDITLGGGVKQAARALDPLVGKTPLLYAQIGNMDRAEITDWLEEKGWNLHGRARELFTGVMAIGVGCSPFTPFGTPSEHPESRLAEWMEQALGEARDKAALAMDNVSQRSEVPSLVLVAHTPPHDSACDRLHNGVSVGSVAVREFIEEHQPDVCLCGHIHESRAEERIGRTHVINPGPLGGGGYALLWREVAEGGIRARAKLMTL